MTEDRLSTEDKKFLEVERALKEAALNPLRHATEELFGDFLKMENITEICYNGNKVVWVLKNNGEWQPFDVRDRKAFSLSRLMHFARCCASFKKKTIDNYENPILSSNLANGERVQIVLSPVTVNDETISISIRIPSKTTYPHSFFEEQGFYNLLDNKEQAISAIKDGIAIGKNVIVCGGTGSGKTTYIKSIMEFIPKEERIISIEDTEEIVFKHHKNYTQLFFGGNITSADCLKSCLRMRPDRIILGELRSSEAYDFYNVLCSGHKGTLTTLHAGSSEEAFIRLANMSSSNSTARNIKFESLIEGFKDLIDMIVHINHHKQCDEFYIKHR
ncbi:P-type DNA transfer ATPase VirB11 [Helicobacter pylori]|uniref:cag pathogenicity island type IV secretion system ATPase VirB11 n=1 Tax=Helicobacter pylori TaxID=210 RepID=UPI000FDE2781|nr:cag pathogenicity island type IV secretion system ATPase VirB11 [Helicobacter pylori]RVZ00721.1 P-type DNA transfer ATPase VirB11 [Helicobacter pylori]